MATGLSAQFGTTGVGVQLVLPLRPQFNARLGVNALNYSDDANTADVDYDYDLKLRTFDALLDWHPTASAFRLTTGLVYNGNKLDVLARPRAGGSYVLGGTTYSVADVGVVNGRVDFRDVAPYLGIGWGNTASSAPGWGFSVDLGVMFQGTPRARLTPTGCSSLVPGLCDQFRRDVEREEAELRNELDDYKAYPVLRAGVNYRF